MLSVFFLLGWGLRESHQRKRCLLPSRCQERKGPRIKGVRGPKNLDMLKVPAQGGEAGDDESHLRTLIWVFT
jgi:hypothetical protein